MDGRLKGSFVGQPPALLLPLVGVMDFLDFQIRTWQRDEASIQMLVHSSSAGSMRQPVTISYAPHRLAALRAELANQQCLITRCRAVF
jgi:hypothetical protein